jgi:predicted nucleic acid-binding protein
MPDRVYDTRFFIEHFYSSKEKTRERTKREILTNKTKYVSVITLHEIYRLTLQKEGRETAQLRVSLISKDFEVVEVDTTIALKAAEMRHGSPSRPFASPTTHTSPTYEASRPDGSNKPEAFESHGAFSDPS